MKRVRIDFAPPGLRRALSERPRVALTLAMMSFCLIPSLIGATLRYGALLREQEAFQARATAVTVPRARPTARSSVPAVQASAINAAVLQMNLPWRALHDAVQSATPASIALLSLEPDAKAANLRITAEARNSDDMIGYVEALKRQGWFHSVDLVRHEINEQDPNRPVRFQIDAGWRAS